MTSRRIALANIKSDTVKTANAGLWLNKFLGEPSTKEVDIKRKLVEGAIKQTTRSDNQDLYKEFFVRWEKTLEDCGAKTRQAKVRGRLIVGLGAESVLETSIALHHTYGVPCIPGSALKGLARHFAEAKRVEGWNSEHSKIVFGNDKKSDDAVAGYITFFDALYVPNSGEKEQALHSDVMTVHHANYYMKGNVAPADWDDPNPVPFISATGTYLLALAGPEDWTKPTFKLLEFALAEEGIGAKTSSGYGRLRFI
jgi:CRISPR-associated protein Cmr6